MEVRLSEQLVLLLYSVVAGALLSVFYDSVRLTRMLCGVRYFNRAVPDISSLRLPLLKQSAVRRTPRTAGKTALYVFILLGDLLFSAVAAMCMLVVFFNFSHGRVRVAAIVAAAVGFILCHYTVGSAVMLIFGYMLLVVRILLRYLAFLVSFPFCRILFPAAAAVYRVLKKLLFAFLDTVRQKKIAAASRARCGALLDYAERGFYSGDI